MPLHDLLDELLALQRRKNAADFEAVLAPRRSRRADPGLPSRWVPPPPSPRSPSAQRMEALRAAIVSELSRTQQVPDPHLPGAPYANGPFYLPPASPPKQQQQQQTAGGATAEQPEKSPRGKRVFPPTKSSAAIRQLLSSYGAQPLPSPVAAMTSEPSSVASTPRGKSQPQQLQPTAAKRRNTTTAAAKQADGVFTRRMAQLRDGSRPEVNRFHSRLPHPPPATARRPSVATRRRPSAARPMPLGVSEARRAYQTPSHTTALANLPSVGHYFTASPRSPVESHVTSTARGETVQLGQRRLVADPTLVGRPPPQTMQTYGTVA